MSTVTHRAQRVRAGGESKGRPRAGLRLDIEGLRAIAVGVVLLYHGGVARLSGGFAGVDVFFVISGFLITGLLLREVDRTGSVSIIGFYARRVRRLLPAATLVLLFTTVAGWLLLPGSSRANLGSDAVAATLYVVNWALAFRSVDYLAEGAAPSPLQHYWSLSVEEQYYVVWPLVIILGAALARRWRLLPRRTLVVLIGITAVASLTYSAIHTQTDPAPAYFVTTTRVWELAIGSLLAFAVGRLRALPRVAAEILGWLGLAMIAYAVLVFSSATAWPGTAALVPTLGTAAVIASGCAVVRSGSTTTTRVLGIAPMVWLGGVSYSVYLWHWPLIVIAQARWPDLPGWGLLAVALTAVPLAWLTKRLLEDPVRFNPRLAASPALAIATGVAVMSTSVVAGVAVWRSAPTLDTGGRIEGATALVANPDGAHWRLVDDPQRFYDRSGPLVPQPAAAIEDSPAYYERGCQTGTGVEEPARCVFGKKSSDTTMAMLGDSKMGQWFTAVLSIARSENWRLELDLKSACTFSLDGVDPDCAAHTRNLLDQFRAEGAPKYALVSQGSGWDSRLAKGMEAALTELRSLGTRVVLVTDNPAPQSLAVYKCMELHADDYAACNAPRADGLQGVGSPVVSAAAEDLGLDLIDLNDWICPPGDGCPPAIGGVLLQRQGSHLTDSYVRSLTPLLYRALAEIGVASTPVTEIGIDRIPASPTDD